MVDGLRAVAGKFPGQVRSVGVDTWGVDFGLLGRGDELLGNPYCYRDPGPTACIEQALAIVPREEIFAATGMQFMQINTLYQLLAMRTANSPLFDVAESFLMMPDLFHWLLTGVKANELTNATTTQFFDPRRGNWATELLERLAVADADSRSNWQRRARGSGGLLAGGGRGDRLTNVEVVLPGTHDTASAVVAVPAASGPASGPTGATSARAPGR